MTTAALAKKTRTLPLSKIGAVIAQGLSYVTTLWLIEWVWVDGDWGMRVLVALLLEVSFVALKESLFVGHGDDRLGWIGFLVDAIINMGGALPRAGAVITFPPLAVILSIAGVYERAQSTMATLEGVPVSWGGFLVALISGIILSVAPHYLWKR